MLISRHCGMTEELLKAKSMLFKCMNTSRGCQEIKGEEAMIAHEAECIYRLVLCPDLQCQKKVSFHELPEHIEEDKDIVKIESSNLKIVKVKSDYFAQYPIDCDRLDITPYKFVFGDRVFLLNGQVMKRQTFYLWVQMVGSKSEAKKYNYTLELHGIDPNIKAISFGQVVSIDETVEEIQEAKEYFGIDFEMFKAKFVDEDRYFEFSISIKNMKEEAKDDNEESGISDDE